MEQFIFGNIRIQLLSEKIIRLESAENGKFCDENTFFIPGKSDYQKTTVAHSREENVIYFGEYELYIPESNKSLSGVCLKKNGEKVYTYKKLANTGELPPLNKTPEVFAIADTPRIIVPEGGYSTERKGEYTVEENVQDVYLLLCGKNARELRKLYVELTGRSEFVRLSTLGGWNSKYYEYSEESAKQLILDYENHNVPLDNMVIDTDWRSCEYGWGYDINTGLFPDMKRFMDFAHEHGVEIMFNDHPEPVNATQVFAPEEIAYREKSLQSLMDMGLDMWWYDRNWSTHLISPTKNIRWETLGLYLFQDITRNFYQKQGKNKEVYRRPVMTGNVVNVANGCYDGDYERIYDSASHRYSIQWTGDIASDAEALEQEIVDMVRCGNNSLPYISADCGGHLGNPDKELFIRWMQFGALSPVFRPHCTKMVERTREPWVYDEETLAIVRGYNNLRYRLLPVIYKNAYNNYLTGEPVFKALGWEYPSDETALEMDDEYMLGNDILIKPIAGRKLSAVAQENFVTPVRAAYYRGEERQGEPVAAMEYERFHIVLEDAMLRKDVKACDFSAHFETEVQFDRDVELFVRCTDHAICYIDGEKVFEDIWVHSEMNFPLKVIEGGKPHKVEIDYARAGSTAMIQLYYCEIQTEDKVCIYLPAGKWMDAFSGEIYTGQKFVHKEYGLCEMPLFVRLGALLPLAYEAGNTKEQKWDKMVYDFYPDKEAQDCGYLYEDDTETTAYKCGRFRKSAYQAKYDAVGDAFAVKLYAAEGMFEGEKCFERREIVLKYHLLAGADSVRKVTVNGEDCSFVQSESNKNVFPLNTEQCAPDSECICVKLIADTSQQYEIRFML